MIDNHPITPPPELIEDWIEIAKPLPQRPPNPGELATLAARWGADQELEACCELLDGCMVVQIDNSANTAQNRLAGKDRVARLRTIRRPKPPSLKEQALAALSEADQGLNKSEWQQCSNTIRRALEQLDD